MPARSKNTPVVTNSPVVSAQGANTVTQMTRNAQNAVIASASVSSNVIAQENNMNAANNSAMTVAAFAVQNTTVYAKKVSKPSIELTEEQIQGMSVRTIFESLIMGGRIKFTRAANETRKQGIPVLFHNKLQDDQLGRAMALVYANVHKPFGMNVQRNQEGAMIAGEFALADIKGEQDRVVRAYTGADGKVYYQVHYGNRAYNNAGVAVGINASDVHPLNSLNVDRANGYNQWVEYHNAAVRAYAQSIATPEQMEYIAKKVKDLDLSNPNLFVQKNTVRHINGEALINKYVIELLVLLDATRPAFELYTYAKDEAEMGRYLDLLVNSMERAFRNELRSLAGLFTEDSE